jgi:hypothetical protein
VRFHGASPDPYVSARWRHSLALASWLVSATERVRAYVDAGLESRTNFDLDHGISDAWLFRASTSGLWREEEPGYEYGETLTLFERAGDRTVLAYESETSFSTDATHAVSETALRFRWSRRFEENRLRIELAPQVAWRDESDYRPIAGLFVRIELTFGRD